MTSCKYSGMNKWYTRLEANTFSILQVELEKWMDDQTWRAIKYSKNDQKQCKPWDCCICNIYPHAFFKKKKSDGDIVNASRQAHDVNITSPQRRCNVMDVASTLRRRYIYVMCPLGFCPSERPSVTLSPPKPLGRILPNLLHHLFLMVRVCKSSIFFVHPSSFYLSVTLSLPKPLGEIQSNLLNHFPSWLGCARATLLFRVFVRSCVRRPFIYLSCYLILNHWAEYNQTCYITSPHGKSVREQHFFTVRPSSVHLSITLSPPRPTRRNSTKLSTSLPSW